MTSSETPRRASVLSTAFNLINCAIGAGVLSVPYAVRSMGAVLGALSLCLVMAISVLTLNVLTRAARAYGASSYQELVRKSMGWFAAHVVSLTLIAYVFGSCVAYTIVCADSFGEFNARAFGSGSFAANRSSSCCSSRGRTAAEPAAEHGTDGVRVVVQRAGAAVHRRRRRSQGHRRWSALDVLDIAAMRHRLAAAEAGHERLCWSPVVKQLRRVNPHVRAWVLDKGRSSRYRLVFGFVCVQVV